MRKKLLCNNRFSGLNENVLSVVHQSVVGFITGSNTHEFITFRAIGSDFSILSLVMPILFWNKQCIFFAGWYPCMESVFHLGEISLFLVF